MILTVIKLSVYRVNFAKCARILCAIEKITIKNESPREILEISRQYPKPHIIKSYSLNSGEILTRTNKQKFFNASSIS